MLLRFAIRFNFINLPSICMGPLEINLFSLPHDISLLYNLKALNALYMHVSVHMPFYMHR